jgi:hypothetical protein
MDFDPSTAVLDEDPEALDFDPSTAVLAEEESAFDPSTATLVEEESVSPIKKDGIVDKVMERGAIGAAQGVYGLGRAAQGAISQNLQVLEDVGSAVDKIPGGRAAAALVPGLRGAIELAESDVGESVKQYSQEVADVAGAQISEWQRKGEAVGGGLPGKISQLVGSAAVSVAPAVVTAPFAGIPAAAITAGMQSLGSTSADAVDAYRGQGLSDEEARNKALIPSVASGIATAAITALGGKSGPEALAGLAKSSGFRRFAIDLLKGAGVEAGEETVDQLMQSAIQKLSFNPELTLDQALEESAIAGGLGFGLGAGFKAVTQVSSPQEVKKEEFKAKIQNTVAQVETLAASGLPQTAAVLAEQDKQKLILEAVEEATTQPEFLGSLADEELIRRKEEASPEQARAIDEEINRRTQSEDTSESLDGTFDESTAEEIVEPSVDTLTYEYQGFELPISPVEQVPIDSIIKGEQFYQENEETIAEYERKFRAGEPVEPIVIFKTVNGNIVQDGNHRYLGAKRAGVSDVPVTFVDAEANRPITQQGIYFYEFENNPESIERVLQYHERTLQKLAQGETSGAIPAVDTGTAQEIPVSGAGVGQEIPGEVVNGEDFLQTIQSNEPEIQVAAATEQADEITTGEDQPAPSSGAEVQPAGARVQNSPEVQNQLAEALQPLRPQLIKRATDLGVSDPEAVANDAILRAVKYATDPEDAGRIANASGIQRSVVDTLRKEGAEIRRAQAGAVSLEEEVSEGQTVADTIAEDVATPEQEAVQLEQKEIFDNYRDEFFSTLTPAEKAIWNQIHNAGTGRAPRADKINEIAAKFSRFLKSKGLRDIRAVPAVRKAPKNWKPVSDKTRQRLVQKYKLDKGITEALKALGSGSNNTYRALIAKFLASRVRSNLALVPKQYMGFRPYDGLFGYNGQLPVVLLNMSNLSNENSVEEIFLHETVHAMTTDLVDIYEDSPNLLTHEQKEILDDVNAIFKEAQKQLIGDAIQVKETLKAAENDPGFYDVPANRAIYGLTSLGEFISEAMSNPEFQHLLKSVQVKTPRKTVWKELIHAVKRLLGIKSNDVALDRAIEQIFSLVDEGKRFAQAQENVIRGERQFKRSQIGKSKVTAPEESDNVNVDEKVAAPALFRGGAEESTRSAKEIASHLRGSADAIDPASESAEARKARLKPEQDRLLRWATDKGLVTQAESFPEETAINEGAEHAVYEDPQDPNRVIKRAYPGEYGASLPYIDELGTLSLVAPLPSDYFDRIGTDNEYNEDDRKFLGLEVYPNGTFSILTSQPFIRAQSHPREGYTEYRSARDPLDFPVVEGKATDGTWEIVQDDELQANYSNAIREDRLNSADRILRNAGTVIVKPDVKDIKKILEDKGYKKLSTNSWVDENGVIFDDTHDGNFILTPEGEIVPIDVNVRVPSARELATLKRRFGSAIKGPAMAPASQTNTDNFKAWFGNSKVVDDSGNPLVVHHGTHREFDTFDRLAGRVGNSTKKKNSVDEVGFWFTNTPENARLYGPKNVQAFLRIEKPFVIYEQGSPGNAFEKFRTLMERSGGANELRAKLESSGYDGIHISGARLDRANQEIYVPFHPSQIKSATENSGEFSRSLPGIRMAPASLSQEPDVQTLPTRSGLMQYGPVKAVVDWTKENFRARGKFNEPTFNAMLQRNQSASAIMNKVENNIRELRRVLKPEDSLTANAALKGDQAAFQDLPENVQPIINDIRQDVDRMSRELIDSGVLSEELTATVDKNLGVYLNRSYEIFDNPKFKEKAKNDPTWAKTLDDARAYLRKYILADYATGYAKENSGIQDTSDDSAEWATFQQTPEFTTLLQQGAEKGITEGVASENEIEKELNRLLDVGEEAKGSGQLGIGRPGRKNLNILKKRKDIPVEIRNLWGEYNDPMVNYVRTMSKMASLVTNHKFLTDVAAQGLSQGWLFREEDPNRPPETVPVVGKDEANKAMQPLAGLYGDETIRTAFREFNEVSNNAPWVRVLLVLTGLSMAAKTVGSVQSTVRNFLGNILFAMANGQLSPSNIGNIWEAGRAVEANLIARTGDRKKWQEYFQKLIKLGVVSESASGNTLRDLINRASKGNESQSLAENMADGMISRSKRLIGLAPKLYQSVDDFWKVYAYESEKARYQKAYPDMPETELDAKVAQIVRNTYPTYSLAPQAIQKLRRFPFIAPFVTFTSESVRVLANTLALTKQELVDPATRSIGTQRAIGTASAALLFPTLGLLMKSLLGLDDDDEKAVRELVPEWQKNSELILLGKDNKGKISYLDVSYLNPYNYIKEPFTAFKRGDSLGQSLKNSLQAIFEPILNEQILAGTLADIARNKTETGREVYNPQGSVDEQAKAITAHLWNAFEPGTITSMERITKAAKGYVDPGRSYKLGNEVAAATMGQRINEIDANQQIQRVARRFKRENLSAINIFSGVYKSTGTTSLEEIKEKYQEADDARYQIFKNLRRAYDASIILGMNPTDVLRSMKAEELGADAIAQIRSGIYRKYRASLEATQEAMRRDKERRRAYQEALDATPDTRTLID